MSTMTTKDSFPVIDITHKPKRMQNDNLKSVASVATVREQSSSIASVPTTLTLERVIEFYETHAEGEYRNLYLQTSKWLREYMSKSISVNVPVADGSDIDKAQELLNKVRGDK